MKVTKKDKIRNKT